MTETSEPKKAQGLPKEFQGSFQGFSVPLKGSIRGPLKGIISVPLKRDSLSVPSRDSLSVPSKGIYRVLGF